MDPANAAEFQFEQMVLQRLVVPGALGEAAGVVGEVAQTTAGRDLGVHTMAAVRTGQRDAWPVASGYGSIFQTTRQIWRSARGVRAGQRSSE
jgi:hypothetical protein